MDIGRKIQQRKIELGIKTNVELAEKMNGKVHPYTIGKWIGGKRKPRGDNVIALAKALKISADFLLFEESESPERTKSLERMVRDILKTEGEKRPQVGESKANSQHFFFNHFLDCDKVPQEDKEGLLRQVKNLLKLYKCPEVKD